MPDPLRGNPHIQAGRRGTRGNPKACRAVGLANNRNPLMIVVPCHRVIGTNGGANRLRGRA